MKVKWANLTSDNPINEKNLAIRQKAFETGAAQPPYELELIGKKGNRIWVEVHDAPVVQEDKILMMVGAITDITQRVHSRDLMNAVNQASVSVASAQTHQEIFNAVAGAVKKHDITCMLFMLDETQSKLTTKYMNYEPTLQTAAGKILGIKHADFSFPVEAVDEFQEVIREKKTIFIENSEPVLQKLFPKISKKLIAQVIKTLHIQNNIFAPLKYENRVYGIFSMQSNFFTQEHVPTATAFSDQLSAAWKKIELLQNLKKTLEGAIDTIAATIESRDPYTAGHQKRVSDLSAAIASEMKLTEMQVEGVKTAGTIHDLGKIKTPAEILSKPGGLSELEFNLIKTHPQNGFDLLKKIEFPWPIAEMILQHHERMDGSGYPRGLKGDEILLEARILAVADIVEAMSSHRPYRPALGIKKALEQIKKDKGTLLDPDVVDACLKTFEDGYELI